MSGNPFMRLISQGVDVIDTANTKFAPRKKMIFEPNVWLGRGYYDIDEMKAFSYIGENALLMNVSTIGRFCSIARNSVIGESEHPINFLSTSPIFYSTKYFKDREDIGGFYRKFKADIIENSKLVKSLTPDASKIMIGNDVWIGEGVFIRRGVTIADGAIIASRSVVNKDVKPYEIVGGIPAKHIKYRFDEQVIDKLLKIKWWEYDIKQFDDMVFNDIYRAIEQLEYLISEKNIKKYLPAKIIWE